MKPCIRIVFAFTAMLLFVPAVMAQDTLYMKTGQKIAAKIKEVSSVSVRYKKANNPDGPVFVVDPQDINIIKYSNGTVDSVAARIPIVVRTTPVVVPVITDPYPPILPLERSKYLYLNKRIKKVQMQAVLSSVKDEEIDIHVRKAKVARGFRGIGFVAIPFAALGTGFSVIALESEDLTGVGAMLLGTAAVIYGTSLRLKFVERKHNTAALKIYNEKY